MFWDDILRCDRGRFSLAGATSASVSFSDYREMLHQAVNRLPQTSILLHPILHFKVSS
jgi:hypothetical protein